MTDETPGKYPFRDVPLTPSIIASLAREVMGEEIFKRSDLINRVEEYHLSKGGVSGSSDLTANVKKALQVLQQQGAIENPVRGMWRWIGDPSEHPMPIIGSTLESETDELELGAGAVVEGSGSGSIYVYHFPSYKELAQARHEDRWPMKIGMTALGDAQVRIASQQGTAMPEAPVVSYVYRTDTPMKLERVIHAILYYWGHQLEEAPGAEWFSTNPDEVQSIVHFAMGRNDAGSAGAFPQPST